MKVNPCKAVLAPKGTTWQRLDNSRRDFTEEQPNTKNYLIEISFNKFSFKIIYLFLTQTVSKSIYFDIYLETIYFPVERKPIRQVQKNEEKN